MHDKTLIFVQTKFAMDCISLFRKQASETGPETAVCQERLPAANKRYACLISGGRRVRSFLPLVWVDHAAFFPDGQKPHELHDVDIYNFRGIFLVDNWIFAEHLIQQLFITT